MEDLLPRLNDEALKGFSVKKLEKLIVDSEDDLAIARQLGNRPAHEISDRERFLAQLADRLNRKREANESA